MRTSDPGKNLNFFFFPMLMVSKPVSGFTGPLHESFLDSKSLLCFPDS